MTSIFAAYNPTTEIVGARFPSPAPTHAHVTASRIAARNTIRQQCDDSTVLGGKIMIVDDEELNILVFREYLHAAGYQNIIHTDNPLTALDLALQHRPDVLLLDVMMPGMSGLEVLASLAADPAFQHLPVLILTASTDNEIKQAALALGATDFLPKPIDPNDLVPRVRNALVTKFYKDRLARHAEELEEQVRLRTAQLESSRRDVVYCLARAAEFRDNCTGQHVIRVGRYVGVIARAIQYPHADIELLELAAQLHDVGKIGIPDHILKKPDRLDPQEFAEMQKHCQMGLRIIQPSDQEGQSDLRLDGSMNETYHHDYNSPLLRLAALIAASHHERWDGAGYPQGLRGEAIPIESRMTAVADVFDALSSPRQYKRAFSLQECIRLLKEGSGTQFDPAVMNAFLSRWDEILQIYGELQDNPETGN